jgi:hypothetical protein
MLTIILDDDTLRRGLFPGPNKVGAGSNKHPKLELEWEVACRLLQNDDMYSELFERSTRSSGGRERWVIKIRNKLEMWVSL